MTNIVQQPTNASAYTRFGSQELIDAALWSRWLLCCKSPIWSLRYPKDFQSSWRNRHRIGNVGLFEREFTKTVVTYVSNENKHQLALYSAHRRLSYARMMAQLRKQEGDGSGMIMIAGNETLKMIFVPENKARTNSSSYRHSLGVHALPKGVGVEQHAEGCRKLVTRSKTSIKTIRDG